VPHCDFLHRIDLQTLPAGRYWHVYRLTDGPLIADKAPNRRFALVKRDDGLVAERASFGIGWSLEAAIWEWALRDLTPHFGGGIAIPPGTMSHLGLATLRLTRDLDVVALNRPHRRLVLDPDTPEDQRWDRHIATSRYRRTHAAAATVDAQFRSVGLTLPGFQWHSRQLPSDRVALLYEPFFNPADWRVDHTLRLDGVDGQDIIAGALWRARVSLVGDLRCAGEPAPPGVF